jgi:hypothetical protein
VTPLDTVGLDIYHPGRTYTVDGHTIHIDLHGTRWRWDIHTPDGDHLTGYEQTAGRAGRFALHALQQQGAAA